MNTLKSIIAAAAVTLTAGSAMADGMRDVIRLNYNDGTSDYILASDISRISFTKAVDAESQAYQATSVMFDSMKRVFQVGSAHSDFGYPALMLGMDLQTPYMMAQNTGYNWFLTWAKFENCGLYSTSPNVMMWRYCYTYVAEANKVIAALPTPTGDEERLLAAQGYAFRSFAYWNLAQTFAHNVHFAPNAQCVPIISESNNPTTGADATYPASTTGEVYDFIMADIDRAIMLLSDNSLNPAYIDVAHAKRYIDLSVAYGLRARYNLSMHNYAEAAADARSAIEASASTPLLYEMAGFPGFNNVKLGNWMWGITVDENDETARTGIVNWASHISSLVTNGYTYQGGTYRACTDEIWNYLESQPEDVRTNWFANGTYHSDLLTNSQNKVLAHYKQWSLKHPNLKFDAYKSSIYGTVQAGDIPLMRIEEMYLIEAEGMVMSGRVAEGTNALNNFVRTYRNPAFTCAATTAADIQSEIIRQRAVEFWGEGLTFFDMMRLQLDLDRCSGYYNVEFEFRIRGGSDFFRLKYPQMPPYVDGYDYEQEYALPTIGGEWND